MGIFDFVKKGAQELFIARPDEAKDLIVYKWPDQTIPMRAQLTVAEDEVAAFYKDGKFVDFVKPGKVTLDTQNIPFLSRLIDTFTGGNYLKAEVWFITTREVAGKHFGGPIGDVGIHAIDALRFDRPIWVSETLPFDALLPEKPANAISICFIAGSAERASNGVVFERADAAGRFTRGSPLLLAEQVHVRTDVCPFISCR